MKKQPSIQICDAKLKGASGYRVKSVGKNGEPLQNSEILESVKAVKIHVSAMLQCWNIWDWKDLKNSYPSNVFDHTRLQVFAKKNFGNPAPTDKLKFTKQK